MEVWKNCLPWFVDDTTNVSGATAQFNAILQCHFRCKLEKAQFMERDTNGRLQRRTKWVFHPWTKVDGNPAYEWLRARSRLIRGPRLIPLLVTCEYSGVILRKEIAINSPKPLPVYVAEMYKKYVERYSKPEVQEAYDKSRLTGGSIDGVANALGQIASPHSAPNIPPKLWYLAMLLWHHIHGWTPKRTAAPPKFHRGCYVNLDIPSNTSGGLYFTTSTSMDIPGYRVKFCGNVHKGGQFLFVCKILDQLNEKLRQAYRSGYRGFNRDLYPTVTILPEVKVEGKGPGVDPNKNRIFFNPPMWLYVLMKHMFQGIIKFTSSRGFSGIGVKWGNGYAQRLYDAFKGMQYFFDGDKTNQDISVLGQLFSVLVACRVLYVDPNIDPESYWIWRHHLEFIVDLCCCKIIQWPDEMWRVMSGLNASGFYDTTDVNTVYCGAAWICWILTLIISEKVSDEHKRRLSMVLFLYVKAGAAETEDEANSYLEKVEIVANFSGDDEIWARKLDLSCVDARDYVRFVKENLKGLIKWKNSHITDQFLSEFDAQKGEVIMHDWVTPDGEVVKKPRGLQFLKMYFAETPLPRTSEMGVVPVRSTNEFYHRVGMTATNLTNPAMELARLHGLMYSTGGTNEVTYDLLAGMANILLELEPTAIEELLDMKQDDPELIRLQDDMKFRGFGLMHSHDFRKRPDWYKLRDDILNSTYMAKILPKHISSGAYHDALRM